MARSDSNPTPRTLAVLPILLAVALLAAIADASQATAAVRTAHADYGKAERIETAPIAKRPWGEPRSAMSLPPERVGELTEGDKLEAGGDFEVTVCLKPNPNHPGSGQPCVGDMYGFNPKIKARLVLAPSAGTANPAQTKPISKTVSLTCRQDQPNRNHHCVVSIPWSSLKIKNLSSLPCSNGRCHVNMLVSASHPGAGSNNKVVIGSSDDNKRVHQGLAQLSTVRHRPGKSKPSKRWRGGRGTRKLPVVSENSKIKRKVIYSAKVSKLKAGDQLVVDARARTAIGHLPYNVFQRTEVVFAKTKNSTRAYGKPLGTTGRLSASNGFNCTQGKSAHKNVCEMRKTGILSVRKRAKGPFYINVVAGQHAIGTKAGKWRKGHRAKIAKRGGYVRIKRYRGSSACKTCATGWTDFSAKNRPKGGKPAKLVKQLAPWGIKHGSYNCAGRNDGGYICKWRSQGRYGSSPKYKCETRAKWKKRKRRFSLKICKDALGAQLWNQVVAMQVRPSFAGACKQQRGGDFRCKWFGERASGYNAGKHCKGFGVFKRGKWRWQLDACKV